MVLRRCMRWWPAARVVSALVRCAHVPLGPGGRLVDGVEALHEVVARRPQGFGACRVGEA